MTRLPLLLSILAMATLPSFANPFSKAEMQDNHQTFYDNVMLGAALMPDDLAQPYISCPLPVTNDARYKTAKQVDYQHANWEERVSSDWRFFDVSKDLGRVLFVDFKQTEQGLGYRYLANNDSQFDLYEPWSSSKMMAITMAVAKARQQGVGANATVDSIPLVDLFTTINSYEPFGASKDSSNGIATYLLNIVGRDTASDYFQQGWLKLNDPRIRMRGAYETQVFEPKSPYWQSLDNDQQAYMLAPKPNRADKGYQEYRCDQCDLTGNKPMSTLAEAEWLKRLASHEREPLTQHPHLQTMDVQQLFYGTNHSDKKQPVGGMMQGISLMLTHALANTLDPNSTLSPKQVLDKATEGQWRIWQKIGWGISETRGNGENVVLAHVCLPHYQGGREFTIAAQVTEPGVSEKSLHISGMKMQAMLEQSLSTLLKASAK